MWTLVALDEGRDIPLDKLMIIVGRHPQCDVRLDSLRVSRHHCAISVDREIVVRDLGSTNGIRVNGQRVQCGRLKAGDELSIAHLRYRADDGAAAEHTQVEPPQAAAERRYPLITIVAQLLPKEVTQAPASAEPPPVIADAIEPQAEQKPTTPDQEVLSDE